MPLRMATNIPQKRPLVQPWKENKKKSRKKKNEKKRKRVCFA